MSWCDMLGSVPTVGVRLSPRLMSQDTILGAIGPLLDQQVSEFRQGYEIDQRPNAIVFNLENGYSYTIEHERLSVSFSHRMGIQNSSGGLPRIAFFSAVRPYSELAIECVDRLADLLDRLPGAGDREIRRAGLVTQTTVSLDDAPPGLRRFASHFSSPWKAVPSMSFSVLAVLAEAEKHTDKCTHFLAKPEDKEQVPQFLFDWMRFYTSSPPLVKTDAKRVLRQTLESALEYFEFLGEVGLDDTRDC